MTVNAGLPLKLAITMREDIFSTLFRDSIARGLSRRLTPPIVLFPEFLVADEVIKVHLRPGRDT